MRKKCEISSGPRSGGVTMVMSDPNAIERKMKAVAGCSPIRVQTRESVLRELSSDDGAVIAVRETRIDAASVWTSVGRIQGLPSGRAGTRAGAYNPSRPTLFPNGEGRQIARGLRHQATQRPGIQEMPVGRQTLANPLSTSVKDSCAKDPASFNSEKKAGDPRMSADGTKLPI